VLKESRVSKALAVELVLKESRESRE